MNGIKAIDKGVLLNFNTSPPEIQIEINLYNNPFKLISLFREIEKEIKEDLGIKEIVKKNLSDSDKFFDSLIESFKENLKEKKLNLVILDLDEEGL